MTSFLPIIVDLVLNGKEMKKTSQHSMRDSDIMHEEEIEEMEDQAQRANSPTIVISKPSLSIANQVSSLEKFLCHQIQELANSKKQAKWIKRARDKFFNKLFSNPTTNKLSIVT